MTFKVSPHRFRYVREDSAEVGLFLCKMDLNSALILDSCAVGVGPPFSINNWGSILHRNLFAQESGVAQRVFLALITFLDSRQPSSRRESFVKVFFVNWSTWRKCGGNRTIRRCSWTVVLSITKTNDTLETPSGAKIVRVEIARALPCSPTAERSSLYRNTTMCRTTTRPRCTASRPYCWMLPKLPKEVCAISSMMCAEGKKIFSINSVLNLFFYVHFVILSQKFFVFKCFFRAYFFHYLKPKI